MMPLPHPLRVTVLVPFDHGVRISIQSCLVLCTSKETIGVSKFQHFTWELTFFSPTRIRICWDISKHYHDLKDLFNRLSDDQIVNNEQDGNILFFRLISPPPSIIFCNTTLQWIEKQKPNTECLLLILFFSPMTHFNLITVIGHCYRPFIVNSFKKNDDPAYRWFVHEKNGPQLTCLRRTILLLYGTTNLYLPSKMMNLFSLQNYVFLKPDHHYRWISWDLRMCWLFQAKSTIKIRSKKSHV